MQKNHIGLGLVFILSLLLSPIANAASPYDNVIHTTNIANIKKDNTVIDLSSSWTSVLADCNNNWYEDSIYQVPCSQFNTSLQTALSNETGWFVSMDEVKSPYSIAGVSTFSPGDKYINIGFSTSPNNYGEFSGTGSDIQLNMKGSSFTDVCTASIYVQTNYNSRNGSNAQLTKPQVLSAYCSASSSAAKSHTEPLFNRYIYIFNSPINYPFPDYEGIELTLSDSDEDGLDIAKEAAQGTSDNQEDTDGDGLNDFNESRWNPDRYDIFCGSQCAYPNPTHKDIYVEADWMNDGSGDYKLSSTQVSQVQDAFEAKDINIHFDTGQYGGGNELPTYIEALEFAPTENETDFFNLKNGDETYQNNFAEERRSIWHYMITGNKVYDGGSNTTSGVSYAGDDDAFIALGQVASTHPSTLDQAIAGTVMHELGHNLCLSNDTYTGQDPSCVFSGIDTAAGNDYVSAMNYDKQFSLVDYSQGLNGQNDHNDWAAVLLGMNDFVTLGADPQEPSPNARQSFNKAPIYN